jgi:ABC-type nitrate/sulfonate/bicarbonate transport system substrate-binding protein
MSRKAWLTCVWLALFAIAPASHAAPQTKLAVAKVANDFALSMVDYGNKLGTFQKNGLQVEVSEITQAKMIQAIIGGSIDIGLASGATLAFAAKGAPLTGVAALAGPPSILVLVVASRSPITSIDQLRHRTVAVTNLGSLTDWAVSQIALHEHWPPSDIKRVSVGDTGARIATLRTGAADAAVVDIAAAFNLEERGEAKILVNFGDLIAKFQNQIVYASNNLIENNPDTVRAFVRAWFQTVSFARAHRDETVAFAQKQLGVTPVVAARVYATLMPDGFFSKDGRFDPAVLKAMSQNFVEMKLLNGDVDLTRYVTDQFLPKAP